jgi:hypothetical protein
MPAKFTFAKIVVTCFSFFFLPLLSNSQCAPEVQIQNRIILVYDAGSVPNNLSEIDVDFEGGPIGTDYAVTKVGNTWQTLASNFTPSSPTGMLTITYTDLSTEDCQYIDGIYFDPLPVELSTFNAHLMNNNVFLSWSTESEQENAGFEIQRSFDGDNFERIAFVNGAGDSNEKIWYSFEDQGVRITALDKFVYYRLKQIDYDQSFSYSWINAVDLKLDVSGFEITKIVGWNNPERKISVHYYSPPNIRKLNVLVSTINGQIIEQNAIYPNNGFNFFEVDLSNQAENMFFISLNNGKDILVEKIMLHSTD